MVILLIGTVLLLETLWLVLDKFWFDAEQESIISHYLPDWDHV